MRAVRALNCFVITPFGPKTDERGVVVMAGPQHHYWSQNFNPAHPATRSPKPSKNTETGAFWGRSGRGGGGVPSLDVVVELVVKDSGSDLQKAVRTLG